MNLKSEIIHSVVMVIVFGVPFLLDSHAPFLDVTISGVLSWVYRWALANVNI